MSLDCIVAFPGIKTLDRRIWRNLMVTKLDVLKAAKAMITDPARWTQRAMARNAWGRPCEVEDSGAVCWCLHGAIWRTFCDKPPPLLVFSVVDVLAILYRVMRRFTTVGMFNDRHNHIEVLELCDRAIAAEEAIP
jgi:hypothetical protein